MPKKNTPELPFEGASGGLRFVVETAALQEAVNKIARVVEPRGHIPILRNILLRTKAGSLELSGTDLDRSITITIPARTEKAGATTVEAARLVAFMGDLPNGSEIGATIADRQAEFYSGRRVAKLAVLPAGDFPQVATELENATRIQITKAIAARLAMIVDVAEISERVYLGGVHLYSINGDLVAEAGGQAMLVREPQPAKASIPKELTALIPAETARLLPFLFGDFEIEISDTKMRASDGVTTLVSKLLEGQFPNIDKILDRGIDRPLSLTVDAKEFVSAVKRVAAIASDEKRTRRDIQIIAEEGRAKIVAKRNDGMADAEDAVAAECEIADHATVRSFTVHVDRTATLIKALGGETIKLSQHATGDAILVENIADQNTCAALMPMRGVEVEVEAERRAA